LNENNPLTLTTYRYHKTLKMNKGSNLGRWLQFVDSLERLSYNMIQTMIFLICFACVLVCIEGSEIENNFDNIVWNLSEKSSNELSKPDLFVEWIQKKAIEQVEQNDLHYWIDYDNIEESKKRDFHKLQQKEDLIRLDSSYKQHIVPYRYVSGELDKILTASSSARKFLDMILSRSPK